VDEPGTTPSASKVRLDKWLWAARFYKTRSQATEAITAGHVKIRGDRAKAGHSVSAGLVLEITKDRLTWQIVVRMLSDKRGKGADAAKLYEETEEGKRRRETQLAELRAEQQAYLPGRPTKRDRRAIDRWKAGA
jgi:ribosome-associated heat shock protein Hsp15